MAAAAQNLILLTAMLHVGFMVLEMVFWTRTAGMAIFRLTPEFANASRALAANQGLYNGFLAAGLFWGIWLVATGAGEPGFEIEVFFLACAALAGLFGALTVSVRILLVQALPALAALSLLWAAP